MFQKQFIYENDHAIITIQNCLYKLYLILVKKEKKMFRGPWPRPLYLV